MSRSPDQDPPDAELQRLVSRFLDQTLDEAESLRLQQRLQEDPVAQEYCAHCIRFDATLQEALDPQALEWEETRRIVFNPKKGSPSWTVQRSQTVRYGNQGKRLISSAVRHRWPLFTLLGAILLIGAGTAFYILNKSKSYQLRNGDFEAMDLSQSPSGRGKSVLYWQDNFASEDAQLYEIGRVSGGKIFAKSGRNVVRLTDRSFINQLILNKMGNALTAAPGITVTLTGWSYCEGNTIHSLRGSLRFVASAYPDMIQYEAAENTILLENEGWHKFRLKLVVPKDLERDASDLSANLKTPPPPINIDGKELTLSLDSRSPESVIYLDDLAIEVSRPGN